MNHHEKKILLAEDDINLGTILAERLSMKGFNVTLCDNGNDAFEKFKSDKFNVIILDIMMPLKDGFTLAKEIRAEDETTPIIFVTARALKEDVLKGFSIGADDYLTKPFSMEELMMRIQAILKRTIKVEEENIANEFNFGIMHFNYVHQSLRMGELEHKLTSKEADLLKILCSNKNEVVFREVALRKIWGDDTYFNGRSMDVFISKLRKLIADEPKVEIMNVHGKGFKLVVKD